MLQEASGASESAPHFPPTVNLSGIENAGVNLDSATPAVSTNIADNLKQTCKICSNPALHAINQRLLEPKIPYTELQKTYNLHPSTIHNHARNHMHRADPVAPALPVVSAGPNADIEIAIQRKRLKAIDKRWAALHKVIDDRGRQYKDAGEAGAGTGLLVRKLKSIGAGENNQIVEEWSLDTGLLRETRELETLTGRTLGEIQAQRSTVNNSTQQNIVIVVPGQPGAMAPPVPVAAIVSRAARENWGVSTAATDDNEHYREVSTLLPQPGQVVDAGAVSRVLEPAATQPPPTQIHEGTLSPDPKPHISDTHTLNSGAIGGQAAERRQVWLRCGGGHEWGTPAVGAVYEYGFCGRCGGKGEVL